MALGKSQNRRRVDGSPTKEAIPSWVRVSGGALGALFVGCVALMGGWHLQKWARHSSQFALKTIAVKGASRATSSEIVKLSGLSMGLNMFEMDVVASEAAIEAHPWVKKAKVSRRFPSHVEVTVTEHQPVAWITLGDLYLLDAEGEPFKKVTSDDALDLPVLSGVNREDYLANAQEQADRMVRALGVVEAYQRLADSKLAPLSEIRLTDEGYVLVVGKGEQIHLRAQDAVERLGQLGLVREELMRQGLSARVIHLENRVRPGWVTVQLSAPRSERTEP